jgi:hypothetical protein
MFNGGRIGGGDRAYIFIAGIDQNLVKDFVKARIKL